MPVAGTRFEYAVAILALFAVGGLYALNLEYPFVHDQLVVLYAAKSIAGGGTLYINFWDNKLPGLVWFFFVAGKLFGFNEPGIHTLELIWMLIFSVVLMLGLRRHMLLGGAVAAVPLAVIGTYSVAADPFQLTQVESLIGLPIFVALWCAAQIERRPPVRLLCFFVSGLCAGMTVTFKLVYAPLFVSFWLIAGAYAFTVERQRWLDIGRTMFLPAASGVIVVLAAVVTKFWLDGALRELLWTAFVYPPIALEKAPAAPLKRLLESSIYAFSFYACWILFVAVAIADWWYRERSLIFALVIAWLFIAVGLILIQRFSWWPYHFILLFGPLGILGVRGCAVVPALMLKRRQISRLQCHAVFLMMVFAPCAALAIPAMQKVSAYLEIFVHQKKGGEELRGFANGAYVEVARSVRFLRGDSARPGRIYVFGNPLYYHLSGRDPALPIIGWPWHYFLDEQWLQIPRQLARARPPYIYVDRENRILMEKRGGGVLEFLLENYVPFNPDHDGIWYQRKADVEAAR